MKNSVLGEDYQALINNLCTFNMNKIIKNHLDIINRALPKRENNIRVHLENVLLKRLITKDEFDFLNAKLNLSRMCHDLETVLESISVSIMFYNSKDNKIYHGACPSIPAAFFDFFNDINELGTFNENVASCGKAVLTAEIVRADIRTSPLWAELKEHYVSRGLQYAISIPFYNIEQQVAGTYALLANHPMHGVNKDKIQMIQEKTSMFTLEIQKISDRLANKEI